MVAYETNGRRLDGQLSAATRTFRSGSIRGMPDETTLRADFALAFCDKHADRLRELVHPESTSTA